MRLFPRDTTREDEICRDIDREEYEDESGDCYENCIHRG
jgi:hypothetical protein